MTLIAIRFGGVVLALVTITVGVLIDRAVEAIAVAAVLYVVSTYVRRLVAKPDDAMPGGVDGRTS